VVIIVCIAFELSVLNLTSTKKHCFTILCVNVMLNSYFFIFLYYCVHYYSVL